jgi:hypothetical protein
MKCLPLLVVVVVDNIKAKHLTSNDFCCCCCCFQDKQGNPISFEAPSKKPVVTAAAAATAAATPPGATPAAVVVTPPPSAPTVSAEEAGQKLKQAALQRMMGVTVDMTKKEETAPKTTVEPAPKVVVAPAVPKAEPTPKTAEPATKTTEPAPKTDEDLKPEPPKTNEDLTPEPSNVSEPEPVKSPPPPQPLSPKAADLTTTNGTRNIPVAEPASEAEAAETAASRPLAPAKKKSMAALVKETPAVAAKTIPAATEMTKKKQRSTAFYSKTELLGYVVFCVNIGSKKQRNALFTFPKTLSRSYISHNGFHHTA